MHFSYTVLQFNHKIISPHSVY